MSRGQFFPTVGEGENSQGKRTLACTIKHVLTCIMNEKLADLSVFACELFLARYDCWLLTIASSCRGT